MTNLLDSKKAQEGGESDIGRMIGVITFLFSFGFLSIFAYYFLSSFNTELMTTGYYTGEVAYAGNTFLRNIAYFDWVIPVLMAGLLIGIGTFFYYTSRPTVYFLVIMIMASFMGFVSYFFNFLFQQLLGAGIPGYVLVVFPKTIFICSNLHWIALIALGIGSITAYTKDGSGSASQPGGLI